MDTMQVARSLSDELAATVGGDWELRQAAGTVASWAAFEDPHRWPPLSTVGLCRRGLIGGYAQDLEYLQADAELMERAAAGLRLLIAHTEATHPLARRRQRQRAAAVTS